MLTLLIAVCLTTQDLKSAQCQTGCLWAGYDNGYFEADHCVCTENKNYQATAQTKKFTLNAKRKAPTDE